MTLSLSRTNLLRQFALFVVIIAFSVGLVAARTHQDKRLSVIDEVVHVDYLFRAEAGGIAKPGDHIGAQARHEAGCRGFDTEPPRSSCQPPTELAPDAGSTAEQNPPIYYYATYGIAQALRTAGIVKDLVTAGRLADGAWLGLGLFLVWLAARELGASLISRLGIIVTVGANGGVFYMSSIVNPDATAIAGGAAVLLGVLLWERRKMSLAVPVLAAALAILLKNTTVVGILAVCLYLLIRALAKENNAQRPRHRYVLAASAIAGSALTAEVGWLAFRKGILPSVPISHLAAPQGLQLSQLVADIGALGTPLSFTPVSPATFHSWPAYLASLLVVGACAGAAFYLRDMDRLRSLGLASMVMLLLGGPLLVVTVFVVQRVNIEIPIWYGFSLLPLMSAVAAAAIGRSRLALAALTATAAATLWVQVAYLHGPLA